MKPDPLHRFFQAQFAKGSAEGVTRRAFLGATAATASLLAASELFGSPDDPSQQPVAALENLAANALNEAKRQGATYCDIRINRYRDQYSGYRLSPQRGSSKTDEVPFVTDQQSFGFGVRVIVNGQWGFAASPLVTADEITRIAREAVLVAKANSVLQAAPVQLAPTPSYKDRWISPHEVDPFSISVGEKLDLLHNATVTIKKNPKVFAAFGMLGFHSEDKYFASSEGSSIQQYIVQVYPFLTATAVDFQNGISRERSYQVAPLSTGWEYVPKINLGENAARIAEESVEQRRAHQTCSGNNHADDAGAEEAARRGNERQHGNVAAQQIGRIA